CSVSGSPDIRTSAASSSTRSSRGTPCGRTTRSTAGSPSSARGPEVTEPTPAPTDAAPRPETAAGSGAGSRAGRRHERLLGEGVPESGTENLLVNIGPSHPAMHGIVRILAELDGEVIVKADVEIGYLHRAFEKECETGPYNNCMPYTDRLNYVSPLINNFGFCSAVEKLLGLQTTERCQYVRVIMSEISRISDHLTCVGASAMELGAFTVFLYMIKAREFLWEVIEAVTGARLTISYGRVGGLKADLPPDFEAH